MACRIITTLISLGMLAACGGGGVGATGSSSPASPGPAASSKTSNELTEALIGTNVTNFVNIGKSQIPLPEGEWQLMVAHVSQATTGGNIDGNVGTALLMQEPGNSGFSAVYVSANTNLSSCRGWKRSKSMCDRKNTHYNESDRNYNPGDAQCWNVNHRLIDPDRKTKSKYVQKAQGAMREKSITKRTMIVNSFFRSSQCNFIRLIYYSDPTHFGFKRETTKWTDSVWHKDNVDADPRRKAFVMASKNAGKLLSEKVKNGFEGKLGSWTSDIALKFE